MENSEIIWTGTPDDQTCRIEGYMLRVELMDEYWWWACYTPTGDIYSDAPTIEEAKTACEKAYREHLKTK